MRLPPQARQPGASQNHRTPSAPARLEVGPGPRSLLGAHAPAHPTATAVRQEAIQRMQCSYGNARVARLVEQRQAKQPGQPTVRRTPSIMRQTDIRARGLTGSELREIQTHARRLRRQLGQLERGRSITSAEAAQFRDRIEHLLRQGQDLQRARRVSRAQARDLWLRGRNLLRFARNLRRLPRDLRRRAARGRSTRDLRLISAFQVTPSVIHPTQGESARISFIVRGQVRSIACFILADEDREGTSHRFFTFNNPTPGYKVAIWDGTFTGSRNQPPETGTYRVRVMVTDASGRQEEVFAQIRVENPDQETVLPRTQSGLALQSLRFDGSHLVLTDEGGNTISARAVSGLKPNNPRNPRHIDYTQPRHQWAKDRGPIPAREYAILKHQVQQPELRRGRLRFPTGGTARAWGPMRVPLHPNAVGNRDGFFLHLDATNDGTAGCIGVHPADEGKFNQIMSLLIWMPNDRVPVIVEYP